MTVFSFMVSLLSLESLTQDDQRAIQGALQQRPHRRIDALRGLGAAAVGARRQAGLAEQQARPGVGVGDGPERVVHAVAQHHPGDRGAPQSRRR
jgi:hypothetical protein